MKKDKNAVDNFDKEYGDFGWSRMMEIKEQVANGTYVAPKPRPFRGDARFLDPISILTWKSNKE
jgi:hypothetical protein